MVWDRLTLETRFGTCVEYVEEDARDLQREDLPWADSFGH